MNIDLKQYFGDNMFVELLGNNILFKYFIEKKCTWAIILFPKNDKLTKSYNHTNFITINNVQYLIEKIDNLYVLIRNERCIDLGNALFNSIDTIDSTIDHPTIKSTNDLLELSTTVEFTELFINCISSACYYNSIANNLKTLFDHNDRSIHSIDAKEKLCAKISEQYETNKKTKLTINNQIQ